MKQSQMKKNLPVLLAGLLLAAAPWSIPLATGITGLSAALAGGCSVLAIALTVIFVCLRNRQEKRRQKVFSQHCRHVYEPLAQHGEIKPLTNDPQTPEEWLEEIDRAGEAVRSRILAGERADRSFVVQWVHKLQKLRTDIEKTAQRLRSGDEQTAVYLGRECMLAGSLAEQLLQYFDCAEGNIACNRKITDLSCVVSDAVIRNAALFNTKKIGLRRSVSHLYSFTDATVLAVVLDQLLDNAVRYTPEKGLIGISCRDAGDTIRLSVEDAGCGIPAEELPRIFDRGYVGSKEQPGSPGMGLFAVRSYLELLGHGLEVRSAEGRGTQVVIILKKEEEKPAAQTAD